MNIEASIIDQRLASIVGDVREPAATQLKLSSPERLKSLAFVFLCVETVLDLDSDDTFDCLTEGGGDFGVDAIHISEEYDGEFTVSLFQAKYKHTDLIRHHPATRWAGSIVRLCVECSAGLLSTCLRHPIRMLTSPEHGDPISAFRGSGAGGSTTRLLADRRLESAPHG